MIAAYSFAYAGQPTTSNAAPDNTEDYCDHAEFEALFNVRGSDLITKAKGFTSYIYKCLNISLGRSSRDQWKQGLSVNKAEIQVGDLVFFGSNKHNIGHVGIVCEVSNDGTFKFIHSSCSHGVTISDSEDGYYSHRYRGARRILEGSFVS